MDQQQVKKALQSLLEDVARQARKDALQGTSNIGSIYDRERSQLGGLKAEAVEEAIADIATATSTKAGTRRLLNGLLVAAKAAAKLI